MFRSNDFPTQRALDGAIQLIFLGSIASLFRLHEHEEGFILGVDADVEGAVGIEKDVAFLQGQGLEGGQRSGLAQAYIDGELAGLCVILKNRHTHGEITVDRSDIDADSSRI